MFAWKNSSFYKEFHGYLSARRGGTFHKSACRMWPDGSQGGIFFVRILSGPQRFNALPLRASLTVQSSSLNPQAFFRPLS